MIALSFRETNVFVKSAVEYELSAFAYWLSAVGSSLSALDIPISAPTGYLSANYYFGTTVSAQ
ncbi:hypothetical protein [Sporosarcina sp. G11-34]|uniref:hypothetical protein n=1 Tax=Sporosarcina sp. G11-34 TaxID=2849605 RepID=UPI0022A94E6F|nr:hypothetical protein [Sporosarcina sp. G11-34]MCZ2260686.1 hypothetical protein [Sporosarcina sp. G11-34]